MLRNGATKALRIAAAVATAALLALSVGAGNASAASPSGTLGLYTGAADVAGVQDFEGWVGTPVGNVLDFLPKTDWSKVDNPDWWTSGWSSTPHQVEYSVPLIPNTGGTLKEGAAGAYNDHFLNLAKELVAGGESDAVLRLGWEFNGNWYKWKASSDPASFVGYWRQVVDTMRGVPGQNFKFDWCPTAAKGSIAPDQVYPGDSYVDYIGQDLYDQSWIPNYQDPQARWQDYLTRPYGLQWHRDFAGAHGKPMTYPEWGLAIRPDGHGGGDNPYFIQQMHDWIASNNVAFHHYFEINGSDGITHELMGGAFPQGAVKFQQLFGPSDSGSSATGDGLSTSAGTSTTVTPPRGHRKPRMRKIRGRVHHGVRGSVRVQLERRVEGGWKRVARGHDSVNRKGKFERSLAFASASDLKPGAYRLQARYLGSKQSKPSTSRYRRFKFN